MILANFFDTSVICGFKVKCASRRTPGNLIAAFREISFLVNIITTCSSTFLSGEFTKYGNKSEMSCTYFLAIFYQIELHFRCEIFGKLRLTSGG